MKKIVLFTGFVAVLFSSIVAQDLHFSQIMQSPNLLNPGAVGVYDGWERVAIHQRNQWLGSNAQFTSTGLNADATLFKNVYRPKAHLGVGLQFYNDIASVASFGTQTGALTLSGILPINRSSQFSLGIQTGFGSKRGDISKLIYDSQWAGSGYDPTLISGEINGLNSFTYFDASAGVFYQFDGDRSTFARNNDTKFQAGFAVYHVNSPVLKYHVGTTEKLARKYVFMTNFTTDVPNSSWSYDVQAVQFIQGGHYETIFGGVFRRRFSESSKTTGFKRDASIGFGCYMRLKDAIIPTFQVDWKGFRFGLSYDNTNSSLRKAGGIGSLEFSLSYVNLHHALFKQRR
jgi:type IX secretion system PorP/SprF family membrane protein|uniref:PorP/SprF family type IX secretion system membrane protein n=1 Tax=Fluviicola sp. TaxID=1917219 RepID=UPI00404AE746